MMHRHLPFMRLSAFVRWAILGGGLLMAALLSGSSVAAAAEIAVTPVYPASGGSYVPATDQYGFAKQVTYEAEHSPATDGLGFGPTSLFFEVATRDTPGQDGTLATEFVIDQGYLNAGDAYPTHWEGFWFAHWLTTPGTYYIQYYTYGGCSDASPCKSDVYSFTVKAPEPTPETDAPTDPGTGPTTGDSDEPDRMSRREAKTNLRSVIRDEAGRAPKSLDANCRRRTALKFVCKPAWYDAVWVWAMRVTLIADSDDTFIYRGEGARARRRCLSRHSAKRCARSVDW
jgi:hypothetical protein